MTPPDDLPESWSTDESSGGRSRWLIAIGVLVVVALGVGLAVIILQKKKEANVEWPLSASNRAPGMGQVNTPASEVEITADPGVYVWSDFDGWHVWVVNGGDVAGLKGTITGEKDFTKAAVAIKGAGTVERDGDTLTIDLPDEPGLVGVDFQPGFHERSLTFDFEGQDGPLDPELVHKGASASVSKVPFTVRKVQKEDVTSS